MLIEHVTNHLLHFPLSSPVGGSGVASVDVLIVNVFLESGASGLGFSYVLGGNGKPAFTSAETLSAAIRGTTFNHPAATWQKIHLSLNRAGKGPNYIALAAIDVACWDAYARERGEILGVAMGGAPRAIPVYASGGYNAKQTPNEVVAATQSHVRAGFAAVKPRINGSRSAAGILAAVRDAAPSGVDLMCDVNEKCTPTQAQRIMTAARECGYLFVEEPLPADDVAGYRSLARAFPRFAALGEHLQGVKDALPFLSEGLCGAIQPDLAMIGGLTPALELSRLANAFGVEVSPHFLPGLFVHLGYACPNLTWLEDFPLLEPLFTGWPVLADGTLTATAAAGHGLSLVEGALEMFEPLN